MSRVVALVIVMSSLTGCAYRLDTNGYYSKGGKQRAVQCVEESATYVRCHNVGEAK
jgi:hypothetical protein